MGVPLLYTRPAAITGGHTPPGAAAAPAPKALWGKRKRLRRYQRRQSRQLAAQMRAQGLAVPQRGCGWA